MQIEEVIGANVSRIRDHRKMSQSQLGEALAGHLGKPWSRQAVSAAEKGRRAFTAADLLGLAQALDVSVPTLFLPSDWRASSAIELADGISIGADEYRNRILEHSDRPSAFEATMNAQILGLLQRLVEMTKSNRKIERQLFGLTSTASLIKDVLPLSEDDRQRADEILGGLNESTYEWRRGNEIFDWDTRTWQPDPEAR